MDGLSLGCSRKRLCPSARVLRTRVPALGCTGPCGRLQLTAISPSGPSLPHQGAPRGAPLGSVGTLAALGHTVPQTSRNLLATGLPLKRFWLGKVGLLLKALTIYHQQEQPTRPRAQGGEQVDEGHQLCCFQHLAHQRVLPHLFLPAAVAASAFSHCDALAAAILATPARAHYLAHQRELREPRLPH